MSAPTQSEQLTSALIENAITAQSVTTRDGSVTSQNIGQQILADQYLAAKSALASRGALGCLRAAKCIPPSSIGARIGRGP